MFTGSVMTGWVGTDEMFPDTDLDRVTHDGDLDLTSFVDRAGVVGLPGEAHVAGRIHLAGHRYERRRRPWWLSRGCGSRFGLTVQRRALLCRRVLAGVSPDQHTVVVEVHKFAVHDQHNIQPDVWLTNDVRCCTERDGAFA